LLAAGREKRESQEKTSEYGGVGKSKEKKGEKGLLSLICP